MAAGDGISSLIGESEHFAIVYLGGAAVGLGIAITTNKLHSLMNDPFSETALTIASVFGSVWYLQILLEYQD